jgi:hypothetical protein
MTTANDFGDLARLCEELPHPIGHEMVTAGRRYYAPLPEMGFAQARRNFDGGQQPVSP